MYVPCDDIIFVCTLGKTLILYVPCKRQFRTVVCVPCEKLVVYESCDKHYLCTVQYFVKYTTFVCS